MIHKLKTWPEYFKFAESGFKTFELRKDDRQFSEGDTVILQEYDFITGYTGNELTFIISYVLRSAYQFGLKEDYCILGIKPINS